MDDTEYLASPAGQAYYNFHEFMERVFHLTNMAKSGIGITSGLGMLFIRALSKDDKYKDELKRLEKVAKDPLLHSMSIMAAWGAFDAFIDDFCKGVLAADPSLLEDKDIKNKSVKVHHLLAPQEVKLELVYEAIKSSIDTRKVEERVEQTLGFLNLNTPQTASSITAAFVDSYKIRNVWAHSSGRADAKFVKEARHLGFNVGDEVSLTLDQTTHYVGAIWYYGLAVNNRLRLKYNLEPAILLTDAVGAKLKQDFHKMYPQYPHIKQTGTGPGWWAETPEEMEQTRLASEAAASAADATPDSPPDASRPVSDAPSPTPPDGEEPPAGARGQGD
ncbi:hypothetical protein [Mycobacterium aquaticum]|uniref:hypothetical protein n=1 Tax=Mycobacterium aquaticum TaxID=1927124 RepID=UPI001151EBD7|nr:hypothetical protein [Mycobacterium aquaticum]